MLRNHSKQSSFHSVLYDKIPENHILKVISSVIDFSFINILLEDTYCKDFGRPAKEPEMMCKLLFLQHLYNLSDEKVQVEARLNLAFMYFIGINPEDELPDKSLLSKFRTHRLGEDTLDGILTEMVRQCVENGILQGSSVSIDATHIMANTIKKTDHELTSSWIQKAKDILYDPKFINQKGVRSIVDEDARVGRKSKTESFYGFKAEFMMTTVERIITAVRTGHGAYLDGSFMNEILELTLKSGMTIEEVYGDKAYFRKPILEAIEAIEAQPFIPVSSTVYRIDESNFTYNKDSDEWSCSQGNTTVKKKYFTSKNKDGERQGYKYYFDIEQCKACPLHDLCAKKAARRILTVGLNTAEFYDISQYQKREEFKEKYKKRASIEGKNAELKRFHGLARARGYGLFSVSQQSKLAAIATNIKRIAAIASA